MKKIVWFTVCGVLVVHPVQAQQPNANPQPIAPLELRLSMTLPEAELVWKALRKLPVDEVEQLMAKIRQQVAEQTTPQNKPVEKKEDK